MVELARNKTYRVLEEAINKEEQKDETLRQGAVLEKWRGRLSDLHEETDAYGAKRRMELERTYRAAADAVERMGHVMEGLTGMETAWKEGGVDMGALQAAYESVAKRAGEAAEAATAAVGLAKEREKDVEADLEAAKKLVGEGRG